MAGAQLARGYLGRPGLTAERFVACPFGGAGSGCTGPGTWPGGRRTGSWCSPGGPMSRSRSAGSGSSPARSSAVLAACPGVAQAAVIVREDTPGDKRLVGLRGPAPVPATDDGRRLAAAVREHAAARLPEYMVPRRSWCWTALPLTPSGKLDRAALPAPDYAAGRRGPGAGDGGGGAAVRGCSPSVLGVDRVGPDDDFFALGGHSLLAVRLASRVRAVLGVEAGGRGRCSRRRPRPGWRRCWTQAGAARLPLAARAAAGAGAAVVRPAAAVVHRPAGGPVGGLQQPGGAAAGGRPGRRRAGGGAGRRDRPARGAAHRVPGGRRAAVPAGAGPGGAGLAAAGRPRWPRRTCPARWRGIAAEPFDLAARRSRCGRGCWRSAPGVHVLVLVLHHIATDGWSTGVLARDLSRGVRRAAGGPGAGLGAAAGAVRRLRDLAAGAAGRRRTTRAACCPRQVAWWREALAGAPPELALPADRPRPAVASHRGHAVPLEVPAEVHAGLAALAREQGVTLFMVVQAALAVLLSQLGAGDDIPVGTGVAGRTDEALDDLVGFFVNTLVLRTDVSGDPAFTELLGRVREFWLGALEHQDVPFERLVEDLAPDRSLARHPLFQVMLTMQNNAPASGGLPGVRVVGRAGRDRGGPVRPERAAGRGPRRRTAGRAGCAGGCWRRRTCSTQATAQAIAGRFGRVLAAVAADPAVRLRQVQVLDAAERAQLVAGWNDTAADGAGGAGGGAGRGAGGGGAGCGGGGAAGMRGSVTGSWRRGRGGWAGTCGRRGRGRRRWWGCAWTGARRW